MPLRDKKTLPSFSERYSIVKYNPVDNNAINQGWDLEKRRKIEVDIFSGL